MRRLTWILALFLTLFLTSCDLIPSEDPDPLEASLNAGLDTIIVGETWTDAGCTTNGISCERSSGDEVDTDVLGVYTITYLASNEDETMYLERTVHVIDVIPPVIQLEEGIDTIDLNTIWLDAGCMVSDNYDSNLNCTVLSNTIDNSVPGTYQVVYQATDSSGNQTTVTRLVYVIDMANYN